MLERGVKDPLHVIRNSETISFVFNDQKFHVGIGFYDDGRPGEVFVVTGLVGSHLRLAFEAWARLASKALQRGVSVRDVVSSIAGTRDVKGWIVDGGEFDGIEALSAWDALARVLGSYA